MSGGTVYKKRGAWWARLKGAKAPDKWSGEPTGQPTRELALEYARAAQAEIDKRNEATSKEATLGGWYARWRERRKASTHDWKKERGRVENHVLPVLGARPIAAITPKDLADLVRDLRYTKKLANRTVRSIYTAITAMMRDAAIEGLISSSPCMLTEAQLGSVTDKDPTWRAGALFTRAEAETMIGDRHIPLDRRVTYAFGLLAGLRPGEAAALRWSNYDATREPLGCLTVAVAYSTTNHEVKTTKTKAVRYIPVHPVLAVLLAEWRVGWMVMFGKNPDPDDLIVPLPPETAARRTKRLGEAFRYSDYTLRRWTDIDEPRLGWRHRSVYDTKSTFITLALEDGANRDILRDRITHAKPRKNAFDGYDRGQHWVEACTAVSLLHIRYVATELLPVGNLLELPDALAPEEGIEGSVLAPNERERAPVVDGEQVDTRTTCDHVMELAVATVATKENQMVADIARLRRWLEDVGDEPDDIAAIAAALPHLLAVYEAALAWREGRDRNIIGTAPPGGHRSATGVALIDAIDATRDPKELTDGRP